MKKAQPKTLSLAGLTAWLRTKPQRGRYNFVDNQNCLLAQYFKSRGMDDVLVLSGTFFTRRKWGKLPRSFQRIASPTPSTFGAALERAREEARS